MNEVNYASRESKLGKIMENGGLNMEINKYAEYAEGENELVKVVMEDILEYVEEDLESMKGRMEEILQHGCVSGTVGMLIYYSDTHKFFDNNYDDIMEIAKELEDEFGQPIYNSDKGDMKNFYAWLGYEETVRKIYNHFFEQQVVG